MAERKQDKASTAERPGFWQRAHKGVGWLLGAVAPFVAPFFPTAASAPQGAVLYFEFAGIVAGWFGFGTGWLLWNRSGVPQWVGWLVTALAVAGAIIFLGSYSEFLWGIDSPTRTEEWQMLGLYALVYFCVFFVVSFVYWAGGKFILEKLVQI